MRVRAKQWSAAVAAATVLITPAIVGATDASATPGARSRDRIDAVAALRADGWAAAADAASLSRRGPTVGRGSIGLDGLTYDPAPIAVRGIGDSGVMFFGEDFDDACFDSPRFRNALDRLAALARVIEKSGRRVVFTAAPNKSSVETDLLDPHALPHGKCDAVGLRQQRKLLDAFRDKAYLPLRLGLASTEHRTYWRTDTHWTTVGGEVYAKSLARRLSPKLAKRQKYTTIERSQVGDIMQLLYTPMVETAPARIPTDFVHVQWTAGGDPQYGLTGDTTWKTTPAKKTWRGHTVLLGDSFTFTALENLRPLFAKARFLWIGLSSVDQMAESIAQADTVVIEVVQRYVVDSVLGLKSFRQEVRKQLKH